jgi:hypothetical protein
MFGKEFFVFWGVALVFASVILFFFIKTTDVVSKNSYERGYVEACKDSYKGKLKYNLVTNPDGTREWKKVK